MLLWSVLEVYSALVVWCGGLQCSCGLLWRSTVLFTKYFRWEQIIDNKSFYKGNVAITKVTIVTGALICGYVEQFRGY